MSKNTIKHSLVNVPPLYSSMLVVWGATKSQGISSHSQLDILLSPIIPRF